MPSNAMMKLLGLLGQVECNALNIWKIIIFKSIDSRISFYCNNLDLLPHFQKIDERDPGIPNFNEIKKECKDQESIQSSTTSDQGYQVTTSELDSTNESQEVALSQQVTTRHQQTDVNEGITKQGRNNTNDPQKKHRLGTVSKIFYWRT